jgi:hypothetical protein
VAGSFELGHKLLGSLMGGGGISRPAEPLSASEHGLCCPNMLVYIEVAESVLWSKD